MTDSDLAGRLDRIETKIDRNNAEIKAVKEEVAKNTDLRHTVQYGYRTLAWVGGLGIAVAGGYAAVKSIWHGG